MSLEKIDITLDAVFLGDNDPMASPRSVREYHINQNRQSNLLNDTLNSRSMGESMILAEALSYFVTLFGRVPKWVKNHKHFDFDESLQCHCCGASIHLLNSSFYGICYECDGSLNEIYGHGSILLDRLAQEKVEITPELVTRMGL